jgi:tetratricopeptide (TPR) repeat protein
MIHGQEGLMSDDRAVRARARSARRAGRIASALLVLVAFTACQSERRSGGAAVTGAIPRFTGLGSVHHKVGTRSPEAQRMFDQGLRLCYAFNHDEAIRSFREAARLDSSCAMCWWGVALAYGPNINLPMSAEAEQHALDALKRAQSLAPQAPESDRAYIEALSKRYGTPAGEARAARDSAYADAMRALRTRYPRDPDVATLSAEALMDLRPWDLYTLDGAPQPGTPEIVATLESVLRYAPRHTGALHLYIHALEASSTPERAEGVADRLATLTPEAGHLIHMPSHIYLRVGRYRDAETINARAIEVDRTYIDRYDVQTVYRMMYYPHNIHMRWSALCSGGKSAAAAEAARDLAAAVPWTMVRQMPPMEFFRAVDYFTPARFGKWDEILSSEAPPSDMLVTTSIWRYARGLALAATGKAGEARAERDSVVAIARRIPDDVYYGLNPGRPLIEFASVLLDGEIAAREGRTEEAIRLLARASSLQDSLRYDEPPPWYGTARQALGAVLLRAGRPREAGEVYRADLKRVPENGWSLYGLAEAEAKTGANPSSKRAAGARFRKAWSEADVELTSSWF